MDMLAQTTVSTDIGPMVVHRGGEAGPWLICWPTLLGDHRSMREFARYLMHRHRVLLVDPPGFGANNGIQHWPTLDQQAAMAQQIVDALAIDNFHWIGHGFGGHVGAALATRVGYRMLSLTLSSTPLVQSLQISMMSRLLTSLLSLFAPGRRFGVGYMARQMVAGNAVERELTRFHMVTSLEQCNAKVLRHLRPTPAALLTRLRERLEPINIPKLVLAGRDDNLVLPRDQHTLADVLRARYEEVDSSFMTFLAQPEECAIALLAFLEDYPRPATD